MKKIIAFIKDFSKRPSFEVVSFLTLATVFVNLSVATIDKFSIWFDEAFGAYLIKFNFFEVAKYTAYDVHPPLYYWLLKIWSMLFGNSEVALRSMSIFFGVIAMLFIYLLVKRLFNKKTAILSLVFVVISPILIRYAQEARMYTLILAIAFAATYMLVIATNSKKKLPWIIYGILVALGMLTHYFTALIWITHWVWRFDSIRRINPSKKIFKTFFSKNWLIAHGVAIAIFSPWLPWLFIQTFVVQAYGFWIPPVTLDTLTNFVTNSFLYKDVMDATSWLAILVVTLLAVTIFMSIKFYKKSSAKVRTSFRLILFMVVVPIALLFTMSMPPMRPYFVDRYLFVPVISFSILVATTLGSGLTSIKNKTIFIIPGLFILAFVLGIGNVYQIGNFNKNTQESNNARQIVKLISEYSSLEEPIVVNNQYFFYETVFYESNLHKVYFIGSDTYQGSTKMLENENIHKIKNLNQFTRDNKIVWYVGRPGSGSFDAPFNCDRLATITLDDTVTNEPAYQAIQCQVTN